ANKSFYKKFLSTEDTTEGFLLYDLGNGQWNIPKLRQLLEEIVQKDSSFEGFEVERDFPGLGKKTMLLNAHRIIRPSHREELILLAISDITERTKAVELMIVNERALIDTNRKLEYFIKTASHELKTPITSMKGYIQLILSLTKAAERPSPLIRSSLEKVEKQVQRIIRLVSGLLDMSKFESAVLELERTKLNLNSLVKETIEEILYIHKTRHVKIDEDGEYELWGDPDRLGQVISNLLNNSIKFSPVDTQIEVKISKHETNEVAVKICDHGIGIEKSEQIKIFERFYRAEDKHQQTYPGFGLGLYIVSEILKSHHGRIWVESEKGKGSTFTFTLPVENKKANRKRI
ncbi:MAG TPA: HAMP domain-containing sensor histidine kinase, partial [Puia sp.]|nr:HAMP domain-containing sensor histidine kinase [Puia sp.]